MGDPRHSSYHYASFYDRHFGDFTFPHSNLCVAKCFYVIFASSGYESIDRFLLAVTIL